MGVRAAAGTLTSRDDLNPASGLHRPIRYQVPWRFWLLYVTAAIAAGCAFILISTFPISTTGGTIEQLL